MTLRLFYVTRELVRMCSEGADMKSLGRCALELIVARGEIEQAGYSEEEKSKVLQRVKELEQTVIYFVPEAMARRINKTVSYEYPEKLYPRELYRDHLEETKHLIFH